MLHYIHASVKPDGFLQQFHLFGLNALCTDRFFEICIIIFDTAAVAHLVSQNGFRF